MTLDRQPFNRNNVIGTVFNDWVSNILKLVEAVSVNVIFVTTVSLLKISPDYLIWIDFFLLCTIQITHLGLHQNVLGRTCSWGENIKRARCPFCSFSIKQKGVWPQITFECQSLWPFWFGLLGTHDDISWLKVSHPWQWKGHFKNSPTYCAASY